MVESIIKETREVGTSAGVLLPRSWLNKKVVVTLHQPTFKEIVYDVMKIVIAEKLNEEIKGVYLIGSYARKEQTNESDIDILMITEDTNRIIKTENYEVIVVSEKNLDKNLKNSLSYQVAIKEGKTILNHALLEEYKNKKVRFNHKPLIIEINKINRINEESLKLLKENNMNVPEGIIYSIVLRINELLLIRSINNNSGYSKKELIKIVGEESYDAYLRIKNEVKEKSVIPPEKALELVNITKKWLREIKG